MPIALHIKPSLPLAIASSKKVSNSFTFFVIRFFASFILSFFSIIFSSAWRLIGYFFVVRSLPSTYRASNKNKQTGYRSMKWFTKYFRLLCINSWKGSNSPVWLSIATTSPSTIASFALILFIIKLTISGYWLDIFSSLLENKDIWDPFLCAWIRSPSYLYSAAHTPFSLSNISSVEERRSASIGLIGSKIVTWISFIPFIPFSATIFATLPRSEETLYARSITDLLFFPPP